MDHSGKNGSSGAGTLARIRWANLARLAFVACAAGLLLAGPPRLGGGRPSERALGLPEQVLRPPPAARDPAQPSRASPRPASRTPRGPKVRHRGPGRRGRPRHTRKAPRAAPAVAPSLPVAPPAAERPAVGEFGP
jgi:hypothetical protein